MAMAMAIGLQPSSCFLQASSLKSRAPTGLGNCQLVVRFSKSKLVQIRAATNIKASTSSSATKEIVPDTEISITKTSFGTIGLTVGLGLLSYGFGAYFTFLPGSEWSAIMLTYGFPLAIIGMALKYAELKPVSCTTYADAFALRESQATPILQQVRSDVTRFRYGDEQHLEEALKRIFRYGLAGGIQRRNAPTLTSIREEVQDGFYTLVLVFEAKALNLNEFETRQAKFTSFFGPGVTAKISKSTSVNSYPSGSIVLEYLQYQEEASLPAKRRGQREGICIRVGQIYGHPRSGSVR
ncbi:hypothetical protein R1flu_021222 [Riccia fluitans]|uniref:Thylakoid membrane protein slr0575 n=1 Tax=Riccia fluitans TaxID=41844 RepID=A0ABD1ZS70_9MARC